MMLVVVAYDVSTQSEEGPKQFRSITIAPRRYQDRQTGDWKDAGLLFPSVATGILRTVTREMLDRKLGVMAKVDMDAVDSELRRTLAL